MMISTKGRYALRVLIDLAEQDCSRYITLREIAERQEISEKYLEIIVSSLVKAGFLDGLRGKGGGYRLGRDAAEINVLDVLQVMEGSLVPVACLEKENNTCLRAGACRTLPLWKGLNEVVNQYLRSFTIHDLARKTVDGFDYII
jgi:Rrf2 family protein